MRRNQPSLATLPARCLRTPRPNRPGAERDKGEAVRQGHTLQTVRSHPRELTPGRQVTALLAALAAPYAVAAAGGWLTTRSLDNWYRRLRKPSWTPPGSAIGAVWVILYTLMGLSTWLAWREGAHSNVQAADVARANRLRTLQLAHNAAWSYAFFGLRSPGGGLAVIVCLWLAVLAWVRSLAPLSALAAWLQVPYLAWVAFAAVLNGQIYWRNRRG